MEVFWSIALAAAVIGIVAAVGIKEHAALRTSRRNLLDACAKHLTGPTIVHGHDDFPKLSGTYAGHRLHVDLIPDTMTIRRLPQLWISVTLLDNLESESEFAVLVRPSGNDFYSLTEAMDRTLTPPSTLPWEVLVRGKGEGAQKMIDSQAVLLGSILADPHIKEIAATRKGLRIIRQAGEGRRGEHLLLRQAIFDNAEVSPEALSALIKNLLSLRDSLEPQQYLALSTAQSA